MKQKIHKLCFNLQLSHRLEFCLRGKRWEQIVSELFNIYSVKNLEYFSFFFKHRRRSYLASFFIKGLLSFGNLKSILYAEMFSIFLYYQKIFTIRILFKDKLNYLFFPARIDLSKNSIFYQGQDFSDSLEDSFFTILFLTDNYLYFYLEIL